MSRFSKQQAERMTETQKALYLIRAECWLAGPVEELALRPEIAKLEAMRRQEVIAEAGQRHEDIFGRN